MPELGNIANHDELLAYLENDAGLDEQQLSQVRNILAHSRANITGDDDDDAETARNAKLKALNPEWFAATQQRVAEDKAKKRMAEDAKQGRARSRFNRRWPNAAKIGVA